MRFYELKSKEDIIRLVDEIGFLPFFKNEISGFSIEEHTPMELWFSDVADGPWEWKGPVARNGNCLYGKFFGNKAGFIRLDQFPDFANYRRDGYDFDSRYDEGLAQTKDKNIYDTIAEHGTLLSKSLKSICNYRKGGNKGFDTVITRLQMQSYVCIADFEYMRDKYGRQYGWGVAKYSTPEELYGYDKITEAYCREPEESRERIVKYIMDILKDTEEDKILKFIK